VKEGGDFRKNGGAGSSCKTRKNVGRGFGESERKTHTEEEGKRKGKGE